MSLTCYICLDLCNSNTRTLYCGHEFCSSCINHWIEINNTCPVCREPFNERSCVLTSIGKNKIHKYTIEHNLINNPVNFTKGFLTRMSTDETEFIKVMFGFNVDGTLQDTNLNNIFICIIKDNIIYFGKKKLYDNDSFILEGGYCTIRNSGVTFPITPSNRTYSHSQNEIAYICS